MRASAVRRRHQCQCRKFHVLCASELSDKMRKVLNCSDRQNRRDLCRVNDQPSYRTGMGYSVAQHREAQWELPHLERLFADDRP